ncbi:MAG: PspA/IM30 family protein [Fusobacteriaceae bacterium]
MGFGKLVSNVKDYFGIKADQAADKLVESNPEAYLELAIKNEKQSILDNETRLAQINSLKNELTPQLNGYVDKLKKIGVGIRMAQSDNDEEAVKEGMVIYKEVEVEHDEIKISLDQITEAYDDAFVTIVEQRKNVAKLENEKKSIVARLKAAQTKEEVMKITGSISQGGGSASSFSKAKDILNKKTNGINSMDQTKKALNNAGKTTSSKKYFDF